MSAQISKMSDMLADKKNGTVASASDLAGFDVSVRGLESWDKFEEVMGSSESSMDQCQKAANALATEWVNDGNFLANLTDENKQYYITQLEDMGVKNAEQIVTEALAKRKKNLDLKNFFLLMHPLIYKMPQLQIFLNFKILVILQNRKKQNLQLSHWKNSIVTKILL